LGIKGALSEWKDMKDKGQEAVMLKEKQQRHKLKREARRLKVQSMGMEDRFTGSAPTLSSHGNGFASGGPTYFNDNPYDTGRLPTAPYPPYRPPPPMQGPPPARF
jgi:hypothetical protein